MAVLPQRMMYVGRLGPTRPDARLVHYNPDDPVGESYAQIIAAFDINLAFLRRQNRDEHTSRSVKLPAAGRLRGLRDGYDHRSVMRKMLSRVLEG